MKKLQRIIGLVDICFVILFFMLNSIEILLPRIKLNYIFWSEIQELVLIVGVIGVLTYGYLMLISKTIIVKVLYSIVLIVGLYGMWSITVLSSAQIQTIENEYHTIKIEHHRYLFSGHDDIYLEQNFIWSSQLMSAMTNEDNSIHYELVDHTLTISIDRHLSDTEVYIYDLLAYD